MALLRRVFDIIFSLLAIIILSPMLFAGYVICMGDSKSNGIFRQRRIGVMGKYFTIYKFRTMHPYSRKISKTGIFFRKHKIDELPQLFNILKGDMAFVGPRPDIPGYYDRLTGENCLILWMKPGIAGPASLKYYDEEQILRSQPNRERYNDTVIFPDKVKINLNYYYNQTFKGDMIILFRTVLLLARFK